MELTFRRKDMDDQKIPFDDIKSYIAQCESGGRHEIAAVNTFGRYLGSVDMGKYQLNSLNLVPAGAGATLTKLWDDIFIKYGIDNDVAKRIKAVIDNDLLNEDLARALYDLRGIGQWSTAEKAKALYAASRTT